MNTLPPQLAENLSGFAGKLSRLAQEQSNARSDVESRWLEDMRQYHGKYSSAEQSRLDNKESGSKIFVNITRNKTKAAEARVQDMLFPTDDRSWAIKPTPVPEVDPNSVEAQGRDAEAIRHYQELIAKKRSEKMQEQIDDQLKESKYQAQARDAIHDMVMLGPGILKGPVIVGRSKKRWQQTDAGYVLGVEESLAPAVNRVNPWNFFPDMSASCLEDCEFIFERHLFTKKQLRDFAKLPGVLQDGVREIIAGGYDGADKIAKNNIQDIRAITGVNNFDTQNKGFEVWEYHGPISKSDYIDAMMGAGEEPGQEDIDELNDEIEAVVFFSGNTILKVAINPLDTEERPYSVVNWEEDEVCIFGFGVPYLMRNAQKIINASWRMMIDNGGQAVSDQVVINQDKITPADGKYTLGGKKLWYLNDANTPINNVFATFETRNHQAEYANIFQLARQHADEETNMPLIAQGEQAAHVTRTSSGMALLMNSSNIVLRTAIKNWDDDITSPLITRFYDWNMQFNEDNAIKGDYSVDARGSSALLVREKQQENLMVLANLSASNPELSIRRDWQGLDKEMAKSLEVPYDNITLSDEEIEQKRQQMAASEQPPQEPMLEFRKQELQLKQQELGHKAKVDEINIQLKSANDERMFMLEQDKAINAKELKLAELSQKGEIENNKIATKLQAELAKDKTTRETAAANLNQRQAQLTLQAQNLVKGFDTF